MKEKDGRTYPKLVTLDETAVVPGDIFRVALGEMGDLLLDLADIVVRVFKVDLLDGDDLLCVIVNAKAKCQ